MPSSGCLWNYIDLHVKSCVLSILIDGKIRYISPPKRDKMNCSHGALTPAEDLWLDHSRSVNCDLSSHGAMGTGGGPHAPTWCDVKKIQVQQQLNTTRFLPIAALQGDRSKEEIQIRGGQSSVEKLLKLVFWIRTTQDRHREWHLFQDLKFYEAFLL